MAFTQEPTYNLNDYVFVIPSYQRGYRWDKDQVSALLNDLRDFIMYINNDRDLFNKDVSYYLQPIVVYPEKNNLNLDPEKNGVTAYPTGTRFVVVDGQQRLTTLYLLLSYLQVQARFNQKVKKYKLIFDKRAKQTTYLENESFKKPEFRHEDNIDTFYLHKAYAVIENWCNTTFESDNTLFSSFMDLLTAPVKNVRPSVKVIWYELSGSKPMETFSNINYGRIQLTGTELVKAILLAEGQNDNGIAINRSHGWDRMEKSLQDPKLWSMLSVDTKSLNHIDLLLDLVVDDLSVNNTNRSRERDGLMFNYYVIDAYLRQYPEKPRADLITKIWEKIEDKFNRIRNWYEKPEWYNYIGLWTRLSTKKVDLGEIAKLEDAARDKNDMTENLRKKIGEILKKDTDLRSQNEKDASVKILDAVDLNYEEIKGRSAMIKILLAFNVMVQSRYTSDPYFPFHLYDLYKETSLEHIHPQHITFDMKYKEVKQWVMNRIAEVDALTEEDDKRIAEKISPEEVNNIKNAMENPVWDQDKKISNENDEQWKKISENIQKIDAIFGDMAAIGEEELHSLCNMALVDQPTNSALSNNYLHKKRKILIERNKTRLNAEDNKPLSSLSKVVDGGMFLMPATEMAFSKHFTTTAGVEPGDMRFWRKEDRDAYIKAIKEVFDELTK